MGLFGVQLVSSRFSSAGVSPMSRPEVLRALQAARSVPAADEVAAPAPPTPETALPPPSPPVDAAPARPSAGSTSSPAPAPPASTLPRPGATAGTFDAAAAAAASSTTTTAPAVSDPGPTSTTATTGKASKPKSESKNSTSSTTRKSTTTTTSKKTTTTTTQAPSKPSGSQSADTRTISSAGGVVAVRFSNGKVELKWARPNPGYQVYVKSNGPDSVVVYFYTKTKASEVRAFYKGNAPASDVREYTGSNPDELGAESITSSAWRTSAR